MAFPPDGTAANETFTVTSLTPSLAAPYATLNGGGGLDTLAIGFAATVTDEGFLGITNFERLQLRNGAFNLTLGSNAAAAFTGGAITVDARGAAGLTLNAAALGSGNALTAFGSSAADSIAGGAGNDLLIGGGGADTLLGGNGNDRLLFAGATELSQAAQVAGGAGSDILGFAGNTSVGDAAFAAVTGIEYLVFYGTGAQSATLGANAAAASGGALRVMAGSAASLTVDASGFGAGQQAIVTGTAGADTLTGGAGKDWLRGAGGADIVRGGGGDDTLVFDNAAALAAAAEVDGGAGADILALLQDSAVTDAAFAAVDNIEYLVFHGTGAQSAVLGANAGAATAGGTLRVLAGNASSLNLDASGLGASTGLVAHGTAGADTLTGGEGRDWLRGAGGGDIVQGGGGNDTLVFDSAAALGAAAQVQGGAGTDILALYGNAALTDAALAQASSIEFISFFGSGAQSVTLGANATAMAGARLTVLANTAASLDLDASGVGAGTRLAVVGTAAADTIKGGAGNDVLTAAGGKDVFRIADGGGVDVITDFTAHSGGATLTLGFDDLEPGSGLLAVDGEYQGFTWSGTTAIDYAERGRFGTGFEYGTVSPAVAGFNYADGAAATASISAAGTFSFEEGWFTGAWNAVTVTVKGFLGATEVASVSFTAQSTTPNHMVFDDDFALVDRVEISAVPEDGTESLVVFDDLIFGTGAGAETNDKLLFEGYSQAQVQAILASAVELNGSTYLSYNGGEDVVALAGVQKSQLSMADFGWTL